MSVHDAAEQWIADAYVQKDASPQTAELRRGHLARLARDFSGRDLWSLTETDLTDWIARQGVAANTRIACRASIRSFYQWGCKRGLVAEDPTTEIAKPKPPQPRPRPVPNGIYAEILARPLEPRLRVAFRLAGELGLRRAEVAALHRDHLIEDEDGWWLRFIGKGNKERRIPCPDDIASEVLALIATTPGPHAFGLTAPWLGRLISRELPDGFTMHKLRHRAGTEAYRRSGHDIYLASQLLGHSSVTTTQAYVQPDMSRLRAAVTNSTARGTWPPPPDEEAQRWRDLGKGA